MDINDMSIADLEFSVRTSSLLKKAGIESVEQLLALTKEEVFKWPRAGRQTWNEIGPMQLMLRGPSEEERADMLYNEIVTTTMRLNLLVSEAKTFDGAINIRLDVDDNHISLYRKIT